MRLSSFNDIDRRHRHIFLSPHFDDAVYSCGGTLAVQVSCGLRPLVITVFGGVPPHNQQISQFAARFHRTAGSDVAQTPASYVENRRKEDATAFDYLQVDYLWLDYLDAIYRGTPLYYTSREQLIDAEVNPSDLDIDKQLAQSLLDLQSRLPDAVWYAPLGVGRHVDHQIVCSAADRLVQRGAKVYFYEDFPYVLGADALETRLNELGGTMEPTFVEMSEMLPIRMAAADMYASQTEGNFGSEERMHADMERYTHSIRPVETVHIERSWTPR